MTVALSCPPVLTKNGCIKDIKAVILTLKPRILKYAASLKR